MKKCCFTGHRPSKLPWGYKESGILFFLFKIKLIKQIKILIKNNTKYFISGMAIGIDLICAELIIKLKKRYTDVELECAIPCFNQSNNWSEKNKIRYNRILEKSDYITYVSQRSYFNGCMQNRNKYMINNSDTLIAVYDGVSSGGTQQTIEIAKKKNISIHLIKI